MGYGVAPVLFSVSPAYWLKSTACRLDAASLIASDCIANVMEMTYSVFYIRLAALNCNLSGSFYSVHSLSFFFSTGRASGSLAQTDNSLPDRVGCYFSRFTW